MKEKITALITTFNSSATLEKALKSVEWCDEIFVVDSFSTDDTLIIAKKYNARIETRKYESSSRQLEYGVSAASNDIVLILDSDEEISPPLKDEILSVLESGEFNEGGYMIPRIVYFLGKWIRSEGFSNDLQYRLIKRTNIKFSHGHKAHWSVSSEYPYKILENFIFHYTYLNIFDFLGRVNIYSSLDVMSRIEGNRKLNVKWYNFFLNPLADFMKYYISLKGYKDGMQGLIMSLISAMHNLTTYIKTWEYVYSKENGLELPPLTYEEFRKIKKN